MEVGRKYQIRTEKLTSWLKTIDLIDTFTREAADPKDSEPLKKIREQLLDTCTTDVLRLIQTGVDGEYEGRIAPLALAATNKIGSAPLDPVFVCIQHIGL